MKRSTTLATPHPAAAAVASPGPPRHRRSVRRAGSRDDWRQATAVLHEHIAWIEHNSDISVFGAQPAFEAELADLPRIYATPDAALFVARDDDLVCGTVGVRIVIDGADGAAEIKRMFVRPEARGRGHATGLLLAALRWAGRRGASRAWLETVPGLMDPAIELYHRHGFRTTADRPQVGVDTAIVMERELDDARSH